MLLLSSHPNVSSFSLATEHLPSDTNTFSTSYAQILSIPFTNCAGGRQVLPLRRQKLGEENTRSCKGMGRVGTKALFAHAT